MPSLCTEGRGLSGSRCQKRRAVMQPSVVSVASKAPARTFKSAPGTEEPPASPRRGGWKL
jgi:hypothetical protein